MFYEEKKIHQFFVDNSQTDINLFQKFVVKAERPRVQKCGCCDLESGGKFILEVGENLLPIHPFNSLSCTSQSLLLPQCTWDENFFFYNNIFCESFQYCCNKKKKDFSL